MRKKRLFAATGVLAGCLLAPPVPGQSAPPENLFSRPAQSVFRDWPPDALKTRGYWLPWGRFAFGRARVLDRPVLFLMTVPWSREAQRFGAEILSDPEVLRDANRLYVCVAVDADRRPDIEERYLTGRWPVVAFLLPNGLPMLSQANEERKAKPIVVGDVDVAGLKFLLDQGDVYFRKWGSYLPRIAAKWTEYEGPEPPAKGAVAAAASDPVARWLVGNFDHELGGFGPAPKFLVPGLVEYALARRIRLAPALREPAFETLAKLLAGPLYDRRDGGMHRMASAPGWGGVQYEKLLDRNAALLREASFAAASGLGDGERYRDALRGTARFLTTVLARPSGGGFVLGQVADPNSKDGGGYWRGESSTAPPTDPLVLSGPNALAGAALIRAGAVLGDGSLRRAGVAALDLVLREGVVTARGARHVLEPRSEEDDAQRFLVTQADVAFGLLDAWTTTGDPRYRDAARDVVDFALANLSSGDSDLLTDRLAEAQPIGLLVRDRRPIRPNARVARVLLRLDALGLGRDHAYRDRALAILGAMAGNLAVYGVQATEPALAIEEAIAPPLTIEVEGGSGRAAFHAAAAEVANPWTVVISDPSADPSAAAVATVRRGDRTARAASPEELGAAVAAVEGAGAPEGR